VITATQSESLKLKADYAAICVAGFLFIKFKLPETKGKTLEEIERELVD
jgi:hypothetical protein